LMMKYFELLTDEDLHLVKKMHPKEAKLRLAEIITGQYHSLEAAKSARDEFERVFSHKEIPDDIAVFKISSGEKKLIDILTESGLVVTKNEARRVIQQGGVSLNGERLDKDDFILDKPGILKCGKRRFLKLEK